MPKLMHNSLHNNPNSNSNFIKVLYKSCINHIESFGKFYVNYIQSHYIKE